MFFSRLECINTFNDVTYVNIKAQDIIPQVDLEVRAGAADALVTLALEQDELADTQSTLSEAMDAQSDDIEMTKQALDEVKGE